MTGGQMNLDGLLVWIVALSTLISFATTIWTIFSGPSRRNASKIDEHAARLDRLDARVSSTEQSLRGMPGKEDIHSVQLALTEMRGDLRAMQTSMVGASEIMKRVEAMVGRHDEHLLGGAKR